MRLCWERKMLPVNEWVNEICSLGRERQKNFLAHASRMIRENFVRNFGLEQLNYMTEREKNFSQRFAPYVHEGNVIPLSNEFERAYSDISGTKCKNHFYGSLHKSHAKYQTQLKLFSRTIIYNEKINL